MSIVVLYRYVCILVLNAYLGVVYFFMGIDLRIPVEKNKKLIFLGCSAMICGMYSIIKMNLQIFFCLDGDISPWFAHWHDPRIPIRSLDRLLYALHDLPLYDATYAV